MTAFWRWLRRKRWLLALLVVLVVLLLAEILVRATCLPLRHFMQTVVKVDDDRGFRLRNGIRLVFSGVHEPLPAPVLWQTNEHSMRSDGTSPARGDPDRLRIATYGDSETFGWSVNLEETFQERMEATGGSLEVLNFGVPGYNAENVSAQVRRTLCAHRPNLAIYLLNPNDFDPALNIPRFRIPSELCLRALVTFYNLTEPDLVARRRDSDAVTRVEDSLLDIKRVCEARDVPLVLAVIDSADLAVVDENSELADYFSEQGSGKVVDVSHIFTAAQKVDFHLNKEGHRQLAGILLETVSGRLDPSSLGE